MTAGRTTSKTAALAMLMAASAPALAAVRDWNAPLGGEFKQSGNWLPSGVPASVDSARFQLAGAYTVSLTANASNAQFLLGNDKVVLDLGTFRYSATLGGTGVPSMALGLAPADVSRLTVRDGTLKTVDVSVGLAGGSSGNVTLWSGVWQSSGVLHVGAAGTGGVTVSSGGRLSSGSGIVGAVAGSKGTVLLSSDGSSWTVGAKLIVGGKSTGTGQVMVRSGASLGVGETLEVRKGGQIILDGGRIDVGAITSAGTIDFLAGVLSLTGSDLTIGGDGPLGAALILDPDRAMEVVQDVTIAADGELTLDGGQYSADETTNVGLVSMARTDSEIRGTAVHNWGRIAAQGQILANLDNGGRGLIDIGSGLQLVVAGTTSNSAKIRRSDGSVRFVGAVQNLVGGELYGRGDVTADQGITNLGVLAFAGEHAQLVGAVNNGPGGMVSVTAKTTTFDGAWVHNGGFHVPVGSSVKFKRKVTGAGSFTGEGIVTFDSRYSPGNSIADVSFEGDVVFGPLAKLQIEVGGVEPGIGFDRLRAREVFLTNVEVFLVNGFSPEAGDQFAIVSASDIKYSENFSIRVPALEGRRRWEILQGSQALLLSVVIPEPNVAILGVMVMAGGVMARRRRTA